MSDTLKAKFPIPPGFITVQNAEDKSSMLLNLDMVIGLKKNGGGTMIYLNGQIYEKVEMLVSESYDSIYQKICEIDQYHNHFFTIKGSSSMVNLLYSFKISDGENVLKPIVYRKDVPAFEIYGEKDLSSAILKVPLPKPSEFCVFKQIGVKTFLYADKYMVAFTEHQKGSNYWEFFIQGGLSFKLKGCWKDLCEKNKFLQRMPIVRINGYAAVNLTYTYSYDDTHNVIKIVVNNGHEIELREFEMTTVVNNRNEIKKCINNYFATGELFTPSFQIKNE